MMRALVNALAFFWMVHFALSGLEHTGTVGSAAYIAGLDDLGIGATGALAMFQFIGFLKFAVAGLFVLTLAMQLAGDEERRETSSYCGWASAGAVFVLSLEHGLALSAEQGTATVFAALAALAATAIVARHADTREAPEKATGEVHVLHPAERADAAAMTAELIHLPTWRPRR